MQKTLKPVGYMFLGTLMGAMLSLNLSVQADKTAVPATSRVSLPIDDLRAFSEVFGKIKSDYVENVEDKKLIKEAINGMVAGLDPHSSYLDKEAFLEMQDSTQGEFGGVGIEIGTDEGAIKVIAPIDDTPASRAGVKAGDFIIKLDSTATRGMSLTDVVKRMRGKPKTSIQLTIMRKGEEKPLIFNLVRDVIKVKSVKAKTLEPGYAVIKISQFQEQTGENLVQAINAIYKENKNSVKGLIIDLRNDPGGLLYSSIAVSAAFLPKDTLIVYTDGRAEDAKVHLYATRKDYLRSALTEDYITKLPEAVKSVPIVVLVNQGTASASEIVAGALQDHKRAIIMGTQTFGKGSVQSIIPLNNDTAIKLTTARYFTPSGRSIQAKGITPDILVKDPTVEEDKTGLYEADLDHHLAGGKDAKPEIKIEIKEIKPVIKPVKGAEKQKSKTKLPLDDKDDFQLQTALNHLKDAKK